jgi:hypothetical protein
VKSIFRTLARWLALVGWLLLATGCATAQSPRLVNHSFNFDGWNDGWQASVEMLAYAYGDQNPMVRGEARNGHSAGGSSGVSGQMPVGEFLYVKWRLKSTGEVFEQQVDLRDRLPQDMTDQELTFLMDGPQLYVYVVTSERKKAYGEPPLQKTWRSYFAKAYEIFPSQQKP